MDYKVEDTLEINVTIKVCHEDDNACLCMPDYENGVLLLSKDWADNLVEGATEVYLMPKEKIRIK